MYQTNCTLTTDENSNVSRLGSDQIRNVKTLCLLHQLRYALFRYDPTQHCDRLNDLIDRKRPSLNVNV